jgi:tryptophan synthase alpha chain
MSGSTRIADAFGAARAQGRLAFVPYVVAGYPSAEASVRLGISAIDAGADLLEVGLPYSDPLADGVTLQRASSAALAAGATLDSSLAVAADISRARPETPLLVMGYANQFIGPRGIDAITALLIEAGVNGAIVADLTPEEGGPLEVAFATAGLALVYLAAPTSSDERLALIGERANGFVYCVSLTGVTGARASGLTGLNDLVGRIKRKTSRPVAVGFGVSRPEHVQTVAAAGADGVIVASALVDALGVDGRDEAAFTTLCRELAAAA